MSSYTMSLQSLQKRKLQSQHSDTSAGFLSHRGHFISPLKYIRFLCAHIGSEAGSGAGAVSGMFMVPSIVCFG